MRPVTDPELLATLEADERPQQPMLRAVREPSVVALLEYGLDLSKPDDEIRAAIAKLPETEKKRAHDLWAEHRVQKLYEGTGLTPQPELAKGIPIIGPFLDEATAGIVGLVHNITGFGSPYDEALAFARAHERAAEAANPVASATGKFAAGVVAGGPIASRIAAAPTLAGRVGQGAVLGGTVGAVEGFGHGEGSLGDRADTAKTGATIGGSLGAVFPAVAAGASRLYGAASEYIAPTVTRLLHGPEAAADRILASRIAAEGSSPAMKRLDLQRGQAVDARMGSDSFAPLPETIADTSDAMRRLLGSVYRQGGEAGTFVRETLEARQRGTGNLFAPRPDDVPGQADRIIEATERALLLRTAKTARATERKIMADQAREGRELYKQAYEASEPFDIQPVLDAMALTAQQYQGGFRRTLERAMRLFQERNMPVNNIRRFDAAKKQLDDMIEKAKRAGENNLARELTMFKNALLERVHEGGKNPLYQQARDAWGSAAENREAIELGRAALRENSEVSVEQYRELSSGQKQLFRIGFLESLRNALGTKRPGQDVTQLFQQRRVRELMAEIIPRSRDRGAVFANRPERFGNLIEREARMVQTRNAVLGNSMTAQRQMDDLQFAGDTLASMWNRFRSSPSLFNMGIEAIGVGIQRIFGYNQRVALELARSLLETNPERRNQILRRLARRGGPDRFARFADLVDRSANALAVSTAGQLIEAESGGAR